MIKIVLPFLFLGLAGRAHTAPLDVTISGEAHNKVKLETLSPHPDIPGAEALTFSLDGGKSAIEAEVVPLSVRDAAVEAKLSENTRYGLPAIPTAPFIAQTLPPKEDTDTRRKALRTPAPVAVATPFWEFRVVNENDVTVFEKKGDTFPVSPQSWDGLNEGLFLLNPNHTYIPFIVIHSSGMIETWPGEAFRFMSVLHRNENGSTVTFSSRVYKDGQAEFRDEAKIYLDDVTRLLSFYPSTWTVIVSEPSAILLGEARRHLWKNYLEKALGRRFSDHQFTVISAESGGGKVDIVMRGATLKDEPLMHGKISPPAPHLESTTEWVTVRENEHMLMVEMQHDRVFLSGSAYLRDAALPQLTAAMKRVKQERGRKNKKGEERRVLLRSYTESPRDKKRDKKVEDPKLAALRSKVLFNLFARERFLP